MSEPVLSMEDVVVEYERPRQAPLRAVAGVSLSVQRGQVLGLVGESGCGKSSLARAAVGLLPVAAGRVLFEGRSVTAMRRSARPKPLRRLQMVFQDPYASLNPRRKVGRQLADSLTLAAGMSKEQQRRRVVELLEQVGLPASAADSYPHEFSGGQRQRICIARALGAEPSVIVADEPVASLDASIQGQIANLLLRIVDELSVALIFISHDLAVVRCIADEVAVMYLGKVAEQGPAGAVWSRPHHPYSAGLMASLPRIEAGLDMAVTPKGDVGDPGQPPTGCRFHPRCPYVFEPCGRDEPQLVAVGGGGHRKACWLEGPPDGDASTPIGSSAEGEQAR